MESFNRVCSRGKERLLNEEYLSLPQHQTMNRSTKYVDKLNICMFITTLIACIVSGICAGYCYQTLAETKAIQQLCKAEHKESDPNIMTATERLVQPTQEINIDSSLNDAIDLDYDIDNEYDDSRVDEYDDSQEDEYDDSQVDGEYDDSQADEFDLDDDENNSVDVDFDASGEEEPQPEQKDHARIRRSDDRCSKKCAKKANQKSKTRCMKRCQKGGKKSKSKLIPAMNLQAAQFEVKFSDDQIQKMVGIEYDKYENKENIPLNVFKPSQWVDQKTAPVKFSNGRAISKTTGIYLAYAQAYIGGNEASKSIRLVHKRNDTYVNTLSCRTGVHPDMSDSGSGQLQTCSVLGLLNLEKGDTVEVQKGGDNVQIILDKDKTYFGIVQLSKFAAPGNKGRKGN